MDTCRAIPVSLRVLACWAVCLMLSGCATSLAQADDTVSTVPAATGTVDPATRVARVAWLAGDVGLMPSGKDQWHQVSVNRPLTTGDRLSTGDDARVELGFGDAALRLAGNSDFSFLVLNDTQVRGALTHGTLELSVHQLPDGQEYEIDTPQVAVVVDRAARIRVDLGDGQATIVTVHQGNAIVYGDDGARRVLAPGQRLRFADASLAHVQTLALGSGDAFDHWTRSRDALIADSSSGQYVSEGTIGYADLDRYGEWQIEADYGRVWFPGNVEHGWAPYRNGHWTWIGPWGWTWVSDAPWGFAPFHYGRWNQFGSRWGWIPGPVAVRAVYAPALVAFFGGDGWRVSVGVRPVGWYPLGPGMFYDPWYYASRRYYVYINNCNMRYRRHHHWTNRHQRMQEAYNVWRKPERVARVHFKATPPPGITIVSRKTMRVGANVGGARLHGLVDEVRGAPLRPHGPGFAASRHQRNLMRANAVQRLPVAKVRHPVVVRKVHKQGPERVTHVAGTPVRWLRGGGTPPRVSVPGVRHPEVIKSEPVRVATPTFRAPVRESRVRAVVRPQPDSAHARKPVPVRKVPDLPVVPRLRAGTAPPTFRVHDKVQRETRVQAPVVRETSSRATRPWSAPSPSRPVNDVPQRNHPRLQVQRPVVTRRPPRAKPVYRERVLREPVRRAPVHRAPVQSEPVQSEPVRMRTRTHTAPPPVSRQPVRVHRSSPQRVQRSAPVRVAPVHVKRSHPVRKGLDDDVD